MQCITFRRWHGTMNTSFTFPIETNEQKIQLTNWFLVHHGDMVQEMTTGRVETTLVVTCDAKNHVQHKAALQFFEEGVEDNIMTIPCETAVEKIAFANWLIEDKLGKYCHGNTHIFTSLLHRHQFADE